MTIQEISAQLSVDVEVTESFLLAALARGDSRAVRTWQNTLAAAQAAAAAVSAYQEALAA